MRLHIVRHADPDYVHDTITDFGHEEAKLLSGRMKAFPLTEIYASPKGRAQATAKYTADALGLPVTTLEWLRELSVLTMPFDAEGLCKEPVIWNLPPDFLKKVQVKDDDLGARTGLFPQPLTENELTFVKNGWLGWLSGKGIHESGGIWIKDRPLPEGDVAFFCHHGLGTTLLAYIFGIPIAEAWRIFWISPSSVTTILFEEYDQVKVNPRMISLNDTRHLSDEMMRRNTSGLVYNAF